MSVSATDRSSEAVEVLGSRRVLLVGTFLSSSLANRSVGEDLAARLAGAGWHVLTTSARTSRAGRLFDMMTTAWKRRGEYAVAQVDVFSGLAFGWAEAACWTLRRARKPYVLTLHGGKLPVFAPRWGRRVRRLLNTAAVVTTPSRYLFEQMAPYHERLHLLPNPLDLGAYTFRPREQVTPRCLWLRSFHEVYNPTLAPNVISLLKQTLPDIHLIMVGADKGDGSLQRTLDAVEQQGLGAHVTFPGGVAHSDVPRWLQEGDIFLNTTNFDNTPVSVLEAMACGLCVVSTNVGGIPYLLDHEHDALLVPPNDPEAMAAAVRRLVLQPDLARKLSYNAHKKAEQFDWTAILPRWEDILTRLTG